MYRIQPGGLLLYVWRRYKHSSTESLWNGEKSRQWTSVQIYAYKHIDVSRLHLQNRGCIYQVGPRPRPPPPKASSSLLPPFPEVGRLVLSPWPLPEASLSPIFPEAGRLVLSSWPLPEASSPLLAPSPEGGRLVRSFWPLPEGEGPSERTPSWSRSWSWLRMELAGREGRGRLREDFRHLRYMMRDFQVNHLQGDTGQKETLLTLHNGDDPQHQHH